MALNKTHEYDDGYIDGIEGLPCDNPFDYFDEYEQHYAYDIGWQKGRSDIDR